MEIFLGKCERYFGKSFGKLVARFIYLFMSRRRKILKKCRKVRWKAVHFHELDVMSNSRTKNSILNMVSSIGYQMISLIMSFVSRTIFLQVLGVGYLGINGLFNDVLSMLNMAELGFGTAMTFSMYKPLAEKDYDTLAGLTNFYKKVYRIIAATIMIFGRGFITVSPTFN